MMLKERHTLQSYTYMHVHKHAKNWMLISQPKNYREVESWYYDEESQMLQYHGSLSTILRTYYFSTYLIILSTICRPIPRRCNEGITWKTLTINDMNKRKSAWHERKYLSCLISNEWTFDFLDWGNAPLSNDDVD